MLAAFIKGTSRFFGYGTIGHGLGLGWSAMSNRALLYRRPSEPQAIEVVFDKSIYLVRMRRHRQARRYTLRIAAATREVILTIPPRGTMKEAREFAQKHGGWIAARLGRLPEAVRFAHGVVIPLRGVAHRITHRRGARGTVWTEMDDERRAASLRRRRRAARRSPCRRFSAARGQARARDREPAVRRRAWRRRPPRLGARSGEPLGFLLDRRRAVIFVAADPGAELRAQLSRRARSGAPRRNEPFGAVLASGAAAFPRSRTRQGVARRSWQRSASLWPAAEWRRA